MDPKTDTEATSTLKIKSQDEVISSTAIFGDSGYSADANVKFAALNSEYSSNSFDSILVNKDASTITQTNTEFKYNGYTLEGISEDDLLEYADVSIDDNYFEAEHNAQITGLSDGTHPRITSDFNVEYFKKPTRAVGDKGVTTEKDITFTYLQVNVEFLEFKIYFKPIEDVDGEKMLNFIEEENGLDLTDPVDGADKDTDGDGISDKDEIENGLDQTNTADAEEDLDGDDISNKEEIDLGTELNNHDSDGDEVAAGYNPTDNSDKGGKGLPTITGRTSIRHLYATLTFLVLLVLTRKRKIKA
ncbi:MAG: hypothetical protein ACK5HS_00025 [Mycoplasmatales bacterium]